MKRLLKAVARGGWRCAGPVRRPLSRIFSAHVTRSVATILRDEVHPRLDGVQAGVTLSREGLESWRRDLASSRQETHLVLDSLLREVSRLQDQVETLQGIVLESIEARHTAGLPGRDSRAGLGVARAESA